MKLRALRTECGRRTIECPVPQRSATDLTSPRCADGRRRSSSFGRMVALRPAALALVLTILAHAVAVASGNDRPWIGIDIEDWRIGDFAAGVAVLRVEHASPASEAGVSAGDIVLALEGHDLRNADDLICRVLALRPGQHIVLTVLRAEESLALRVKLGLWPLGIPKGTRECAAVVGSRPDRSSSRPS
ncbi:MAG: PDZ domain-containing protein [Hyphomicrobiaceae bacterium]|nr:PDZ domain-containing protein [Hyphomicrobiaceae bacterium]